MSRQIADRIQKTRAKGQALAFARRREAGTRVVSPKSFDKAPGFVKQVLVKKNTGVAKVLRSRKSASSMIVRLGKRAVDALNSARISEKALAAAMELRIASQAAKKKKGALRKGMRKVVVGISKRWQEQGRHLLGTGVSLSKVNTTRRVLTMESRTETCERRGGISGPTNEKVPAAFKELCPPSLLLQKIDDAGGVVELDRSRGWSKLGKCLAEQVGFNQKGYLPKMGAVLKAYAASLPSPPNGLALNAPKRKRRRLVRLGDGSRGPRLPTTEVLARGMLTAQAVRAGVLKQVNGVTMRSVDYRALFKEKFEKAASNGGIKSPPGEGDFSEELLISGWTDGGSKAAKGFLAETTGFIDCGRGLIASKRTDLRARRDALERILAAVAVAKESKASVSATQSEVGAQYESLTAPIDVRVGGRKGQVRKELAKSCFGISESSFV
jgi:hypothetical protein